MDPIVCPCLSSSLSVVERQDCAGSCAVMCADSVSEMAMEPYLLISTVAVFVETWWWQ